MPQKRYDKKTKAAILKVTTEARAAGKAWAEAYKAAQTAGYTGSRPAIEQMIRFAQAKKPGQKPAAKRGRPAGKRRGRPPTQVKAVAGLDAVQQIVKSTVQQQVNAAIDRAIAALQQSKV
ncbi:MAG TPA: hypothetical protein VGP72_12620 [Planctomycetota bacterium]|jgi:hypothetical protein